MGSLGISWFLCTSLLPLPCLNILSHFSLLPEIIFPFSFCHQVSLENGHVLNFDARTLSSDVKQVSPARFTLAAHEGAASAIDVNPHIRGCLATGGTDKMVKVWNINGTPDGKKDVSLVTSRDLGVVRKHVVFVRRH